MTAIVVCRGHPDIDRPVLSFWEDANLVQAEKEEAHLVREFRERLSYNLQQVQHAVSALQPGLAACALQWTWPLLNVTFVLLFLMGGSDALL